MNGRTPSLRRRRALVAVLLTAAAFATVTPAMSTSANAAATTLRAAKKYPAVRTLLVAGASDLRPAFEELGRRFTATTGTEVTFSFGSSGQLAQQIINGAPFDVFASADVGFVDRVLDKGIGDRTTKSTYAFGRLALWTPPGGAPLSSVGELGDAAITRLAIANPDHAPYGVAAVQALTSAGIYASVTDRLVYGENVSDAYRLATSGNADAALVSLSLVIANAKGGRYITVPAEAHRPLEQALVVTASGKRAAAARAFAALVRSKDGRTVMRKFGFLLTGDAAPPASA